MDNPTWQTKWKAAPLAKVRMCEYENQSLEAILVASRVCCYFQLLRMIVKLAYTLESNRGSADLHFCPACNSNRNLYQKRELSISFFND